MLIFSRQSFRPKVEYDDKRTYIVGRWFATKNEHCVDVAHRGCYNNGTCVAPNKCQCSLGWSGSDCSIPVCETPCLHNGNCTNPNTCTCERGWAGSDCSIALCAQQCNNGGKCVAPDTCQCQQWENEWRDGRIGGGVPIFKRPNGDPQFTGWTGYDCSTPICVQAERFRTNVDQNTFNSADVVVPLGGRVGDGILQCNSVQCPEYDEMLTQNDGKSFQSGCGWDVLETGCCFEVANEDSSSFKCYRCGHLEIGYNNATCSHGSLKEWIFDSISTVPLAFRTSFGEIFRCGPSLNPKVSEVIGSSTSTSNMFLCNQFEWEQGDFIDSAGLESAQGVGADFGLKRGRHIRVNYNNYQREVDDNTWTIGPEVTGEGIFECYNFGSCVAPDECSCKDGYGGFDCGTPLCRHEQASGDIVGCLNGGICANKDDCHCIQVESVLWKVYSEAERGLTGWTGTDCSMPMCIQGHYAPDCDASEFAPGQEGCYRCANGGFCVAPDKCQCADGWSGYDCRTPVCKAEATPLVRNQLMTFDEAKIYIFEQDPCGMVGFNTLRDEGPRGVCTLPNQCTCNCKGSYDDKLCRLIGGKYCKRPFHDPLFRRRNILSPNEIFGTRNCYSGYEGFVNKETDLFTSCHLKIHEPSFFNHYTVLVAFIITFGAISVFLVFGCLFISVNRRKKVNRMERRRILTRSSVQSIHALAYEKGGRKKD